LFYSGVITYHFPMTIRLFYYLTFIIFLYACGSEAPSTQSITPDTENSAEAKKQKKSILFFGNSITAGFGLDADDTFVSILQRRVDSLGLEYELINAGVSGETTASGRNRIGWVMGRQKVDVFVLELGANDGLRGVPVTETQKNLNAIIDTVRQVNPDVKIILAGMMVPPSMGPEYAAAFQKIFPAVAKEKNVSLIPFVLDGVAGIDSLNLPDGIHPNVKGEKIVAENVWGTLKEVL
jgi:acyl-CoA thioesterase I